MFPVSASSSSNNAPNRPVCPKLDKSVPTQTHQIIVPISALGTILSELSGNNRTQVHVAVPSAGPPTLTTAVNQQIPTVTNPPISGCNVTQPIHPLPPVLPTPFPNVPASVLTDLEQGPPGLLATLLNPAASASNALLVNALENATTAALIAQLATAVSGAMSSIAHVLTNNTSADCVPSTLKEAVQLLATMTGLTTNLNNSVSQMMVAYTNSSMFVLKSVPQGEANSVDATTSPAASGQETSEGPLKSLLCKSPAEGDSEEENVPRSQSVKRQGKPCSEKRLLPPIKAPRRTLGNSVPAGRVNHQMKA
ncbi:unnamed protein product [Mesocestoides corti]|uniref:POU domain, class 6, transcription factor 2 n=1 Tax=Mesocestoides corti TaxID=53468 RepID=A0A0R3UAP6_MESCO|nr:unnamed protein product [Mesocestoides corti]